MAITNPNFTTSESLGTPSNITFTDTSTGTDNTLTVRKIYIRLANGNYLSEGGVENSTATAIDWNINDVSITLNLITQSTTASVLVDWLAGSTIVYTKTALQTWDLYDYLFGLELIQSQTATPTIIQDSSYYNLFFQFITNIWNAETSNTYGNDLYSSQASLNRNQYLINNSDLFF